MKKQTHIAVMMAMVMACNSSFGFGLKDLPKGIKPDTDKCEKSDNKKKCKKKAHLKSAVKVVAIGIAAKAVYDMAIDFKTKKVAKEDEVVKNYKEKYKTLPKNAKVVSYSTNLKPGQVVKPGQPVTLVSRVEVVPGTSKEKIVVQEKIAIHDNEDKDKVIKSLVKNVIEGDEKGGVYENEFRFTLPVGMPQGVYPVATSVMVNEKEQGKEDNSMQVVLQVFEDGRYEIAMAY